MAYKDWKEKFYFMTADEANISGLSDQELVAHCLIKWIGLLPENLAEFGVELKHFRVISTSGVVLGINSNTCALCQRYFWNLNLDECCKRCPLYRAIGKSCDDDGGEGFLSLYERSLEDPRVMIEALCQVAF